jgi:hypothetical protein
MIQVLEGNTRNQEIGKEQSTLSRKDFPELEFVGVEEIAVANKIRREIQLFKAVALRYLHEKKYLPIDTMEHIINMTDDEGKKELVSQVEEKEIARRILDLLHTKEFCIKDENGMRQIKLVDVQKKVEELRADFPEIIQDFKQLDLEMDLNINIAELMHQQESNQFELDDLVSESLYMERLESFIVGISTWLSRKLNIKSLNIEERIARNVANLLENKNEIEIDLQNATIAQRCMKVLENIRIDFEKSEYK